MDKYRDEEAEEGWFSIPRQVVINLHTKYEHSSLHGCGEIFYEKFLSSKCGKKEKLDKYREE